MTNRLILLLILAALAGCSSVFPATATREADARAQAAYAECDGQLRTGRLKSHRQAVECAKPRVLAAYQEGAYPFMDLVNLQLAARAAGAERIDNGFASEADVDRDLAELDRRILAERDRRIAQTRATGGGAAMAPPAQLLAGLDSLTGRALPPAGSSCFKIGSFSRCE